MPVSPPALAGPSEGHSSVPAESSVLSSVVSDGSHLVIDTDADSSTMEFTECRSSVKRRNSSSSHHVGSDDEVRTGAEGVSKKARSSESAASSSPAMSSGKDRASQQASSGKKFNPFNKEGKEQHVVFLTGVQFNIVGFWKSRPAAIDQMISAVIGHMFQIRPGKGCIKVICDNVKQVPLLLQTTEMGSKTVKFSLPHRATRDQAGPARQSRGPRGVIRVPVAVTNEEIVEQLHESVTNARRINRHQKGETVPTQVVVLQFKDGFDLPPRVLMFHTGFKVRPFIPRPMACNNCQRYGHPAALCRQDVRCPHCAGPHTHEQCDASTRRCANCNEAHSARFRGCPKYAERLKVTSLMVREGRTYRDAVKSVRATDVQPPAVTEAPKVVNPCTTTTATAEQRPAPVDQNDAPQPAAPLPQRRPRRRRRSAAARSLAPALETAAAVETPAVDRVPPPQQTSTPAPIKKLATLATTDRRTDDYQSEIANLSRQSLINRLNVMNLGISMLIPLVVRLCEESPKTDWSDELLSNLANLQEVASNDDDD